MEGTNSLAIVAVGTVATFLGIVVNLFYTWKKDGREQRWKDAEQVRQEKVAEVAEQKATAAAALVDEKAKKIADDLKAEAEKIADKVAAKLAYDAQFTASAAAKQSADLAVKVVDGMTAAQAALKAANMYNEKIVKLQKALLKAKRVRPRKKK